MEPKQSVDAAFVHSVVSRATIQEFEAESLKRQEKLEALAEQLANQGKYSAAAESVYTADGIAWCLRRLDAYLERDRFKSHG